MSDVINEQIKRDENGNLIVTVSSNFKKRFYNEIILNDYLPKEIQEDVLLDKPKLQHSKALQGAIDKYVTKGKHIILIGNFNVDKLVGYNPEYYGEYGRSVGSNPSLTLNGSQPCLKLDLDNNSVDFSGATFFVQRLFNDGLHIRQFKGLNTVYSFGRWITQRIYDIDPNVSAGQDRSILQANPNKRWLAPIDGMTGFAFKGYGNAGFNTTTYKTELSNYRSNAIDTSVISTGGGGYGGQYPQDDGTTSTTWGSWGGGFIANFNAGVLITQSPEFTQNERDTAKLEVLNGYVRGWTYCGVQVGSIGGAKGEVLPNTMPDSEKYTVKNVTLKNIVVEDVYESGIQRSRFDNLIIDSCVIRRSGHPDWSFKHFKPERPNASQVDPGYGIASGRKNQQGKLVITNCVITDCSRKGIDAHHGNAIIITNNYIKAGYWGIQVALEEPQTDRKEVYWEHEICRYNISNNEIHAGYKGIDFTNGAFGSVARTLRSLWYIRASVQVKDNIVHAPLGWVYNYGHSGFEITNNTFVFSLPYGLFVNGGGEENSTVGIFHGTQYPNDRGIGTGDIIKNNTIRNSPYGNFARGMLIQPTNYLTLKDNVVDTTPYKKRLSENKEEPYVSSLDYLCNNGRVTAPYVIQNGQLGLVCTNNVYFNMKDLNNASSNGTYNVPTPVQDIINKASNELLKVAEIDYNSALRYTSTTRVFRPNIEDIQTEGTNPPAGYIVLFSRYNPLIVSTRNGDRPNILVKGDAATGVYGRLNLNKVVTDTTNSIRFKFTLKRLSLNNVGTLITVGDSTLISVVKVGDTHYLRSSYTLYVNGEEKVARVDIPINLNTETTISLDTTLLKDKSYILLGSPTNGNNQLTGDFKDIEVVYGGMTKEEHTSLITLT